MRSCLPPPVVERARPVLGTVVAVRVRGAGTRAAHRAIEGAFAAMAQIHRLMSFQESSSDVSRMNREAAISPVTVHPHTACVLRWAARMALSSGGSFDASIGGALVESGLLAPPSQGLLPDPDATFRDIRLRATEVYFERPLWIDLGGIAKGYAVDCAIDALQAGGITSACVNAGGDLRTLGAERERVLIRTAVCAPDPLPVLELRGGALATSCGAGLIRMQAGRRSSAHLNGLTRRACDSRVTVSVQAKRCVIADALTKIVLADAAAAAPLLRRFRAVAHVHHPQERPEWRTFGSAR
jgi:thiamine biosynthesis lipoprotein